MITHLTEQFAKKSTLLCANGALASAVPGEGSFLPLAFLQHVSVTRSLAWETHAVIDQLSNVMIKMKRPGNGGNLEERLTRI